jgi:hypothetical protein
MAVFDFDMKLWSEIQTEGFLGDILGDPQTVKYWTEIFQSAYDGHLDLWACRWTFACWIQSGLSILSNVNLVSNIGFGTEGTNTKAQKGTFASRYGSMPVETIEFPLKHPPFIVRDVKADRFTQHTLYNKDWFIRFKGKIKKLVLSS